MKSYNFDLRDERERIMKSNEVKEVFDMFGVPYLGLVNSGDGINHTYFEHNLLIEIKKLGNAKVRGENHNSILTGVSAITKETGIVFH